MATSIAASGELEVLPPDGMQPETPPRRPRRLRRWWWLVPVIAGLGLVIALPVRAAVARAELRGLEGRWRVGQLEINDGFGQVAKLRAATGPSFGVVIPSVFQEQADDLQRLLNRTRSQLILDPSLRGLRRQMVQAFRSEVSDLRRDVRYWQGQAPSPEPAYLTSESFDAQSRAERALTSQLQRLSLAPAAPRTVPQLTAARAALARLSRIADQPIGVRLVASTSRGLVVVDIDRNRIDPLQPGEHRNPRVVQLLPRQGFVVIQAVGSDDVGNPVGLLFAVSSNFSGRVTGLGPREPMRADTTVPVVVPGARADSFWIRTPDGSAVEYDASLQAVRGPVALRAEDEVRGETSAGLFVGIRAPSGQSFTLETTPPTKVLGTGVPLTACGNELVWFEGVDNGVLHVTDAVTGRDRAIDPGPDMRPDSPNGDWVCSPDGTRVAGTWFSLGRTPRDIPGVVDLSSGRLQLTTGGGLDTQPGATSMVWAPGGDRVFFLGSLPARKGSDLVTFRPGDAAITHLRMQGYTVDAVVPLP